MRSPESLITKRRIITAGVVVGLFFLGLILHSAYTNQSITVSAAPMRLPDPLAVDVLNDHQFVFSNGRYFVRYDTQEDTTNALSPDSSLPFSDVSDVAVSDDQKYILFQSLDQTVVDRFGKILDELQINVLNATNFWWLYSVEKKRFSPLDARDMETWSRLGIGDESGSAPPRNIQARLSANGKAVHVLAQYSDETRHIVKIDTATLDKLEDVTVSDAVDSFYMHGDSLVMLDAGLTTIFNHGDKSPQILETEVSGLYGSAAGINEILIGSLETDTDETTYTQVDINRDSHKNLGPVDEETRIVISDDSKLIAYKKNGKIILRETGGFFTKTFTLSVDDDVTTDSLDVIAILSHQSVIAVDTMTGLHYLLGTDKQYQDITAVDYSINPACGNCTLEYYPDEQYFIASVYGEYSQAKQAFIYDALREQDINPDKVQVVFSYFIPPPKQ